MLNSITQITVNVNYALFLFAFSRQSSYAQILATTTLTKLVSRTPCTLSVQQRLDIRNYVLNYLASRPKLAPFVTQALVQLYSKITKLGWFENEKGGYVFRNVISQVYPFLRVCGHFFLYFLLLHNSQPFLNILMCMYFWLLSFFFRNQILQNIV